MLQKAESLTNVRVRFVRKEYFQLSGPNREYLDWTYPGVDLRHISLPESVVANVSIAIATTGAYVNTPQKLGHELTLEYTAELPPSEEFDIVLVEYRSGEWYLFGTSGSSRYRRHGAKADQRDLIYCYDDIGLPDSVRINEPPDPPWRFAEDEEFRESDISIGR